LLESIAGPSQFERIQLLSRSIAETNHFGNQQPLMGSIVGPNQFGNHHSPYGGVAGPNQYGNQGPNQYGGQSTIEQIEGSSQFGRNTSERSNIQQNNYSQNLPDVDFSAERAQVLGDIKKFDLELENLRNLRRRISSKTGSSGRTGFGDSSTRRGGYGTRSFRN